MKYRVRQGFYVHLGENNVASPGDIIELRAVEFQRYAHQLELVDGSQTNTFKTRRMN